jgi:hypothetical protein
VTQLIIALDIFAYAPKTAEHRAYNANKLRCKYHGDLHVIGTWLEIIIIIIIIIIIAKDGGNISFLASWFLFFFFFLSFFRSFFLITSSLPAAEGSHGHTHRLQEQHIGFQWLRI